MRTSLLAALALGGLTSLCIAACGASEEEEETDADGAEVGTRNLTSNDFGLKDKEIVLTLDDGPGPRTVELAEFLARESVPAVFFMVGKNAKASPDAVKRVAEISAQSGGSLIIANHSMTHTTPLPKQGVSGAISEIMNADAILSSSITRSQAGLSSERFFFRPPYGAFTSLGAANISRINEAGADKYTGPVFWDIGGELTDLYSADWACWGKVSVARCTDGYIAETRKRGKGIILVHDVHAKTVDMLMGTGAANGRSLIKDLRNQGFKFVSLRAHEDVVQRTQDENERLSASTQVSIDAQVTTAENGRVVVKVETQNAAKAVARFDNLTSTSVEFRGSRALDVTLSPGSHFVTITAYDGAGVAQGEQRYSFVVPATIDPNSEEGRNDGGAACVSFDLFKAGRAHRLYHGKVACSSPGAVQPPGASDCYRFKGDLRSSRNPQLVGAGEWATDFELTYAADPNDKSRLGFVVEAEDGSIQTGTRYARGTNRPDVPMTFESVDCAHGEWRGKFQYDGGKTEDFLFRLVRNSGSSGRVDFLE